MHSTVAGEWNEAGSHFAAVLHATACPTLKQTFRLFCSSDVIGAQPPSQVRLQVDGALSCQ
jgi:hypothetical protein